MKYIKSFFKSIAVAFSVYSKIPMPRFLWDSEDMKYHFIFFPWVGLVIGGAEYLLFRLCLLFDINCVVFGLMSAVLNIVITGGIHIDGFMDVCDALHSYRSREEKLEILKDPHIGAFAVICLAGFLFTEVAMAAQIMNAKATEAWLMVCLFYGISRAVSGILALSIPAAKKDGMLKSETENSSKKTDKVYLYLELVIISAVTAVVSPIFAAGLLIVQLLIVFLFKRMCMKEFGGISGDLAGYILCLMEMASLTAAMIFSVVCL